MLALELETSTDEPHDLNVHKRRRLPRADRPKAAKAAWAWAFQAVDRYCDTSSIHPTQAEKVAAGFGLQIGSPRELMKDAPSTDFPWVAVDNQEELVKLQNEHKAPSSLTIDEHTPRIAFAGRCGERNQWDGWELIQFSDGSVEGRANNCHVIDLHINIIEC